MVYARRSRGTGRSKGGAVDTKNTAVLRKRGVTARNVDGNSSTGKNVQTMAIGSPSSSKIAIPQKHQVVDKSAYK